MRKKESPDVIKDKIMGLLRIDGGLTIKEVSDRLDIHHITASKYLAVLEAEKKVMCKNVGMARVFKPAVFDRCLSDIINKKEMKNELF